MILETFTPPVEPSSVTAYVGIGSRVMVQDVPVPVEIVHTYRATGTFYARWYEPVLHWSCYREGLFRLDQIEAFA